jgi:hypothetical protein
LKPNNQTWPGATRRAPQAACGNARAALSRAAVLLSANLFPLTATQPGSMSIVSPGSAPTTFATAPLHPGSPPDGDSRA